MMLGKLSASERIPTGGFIMVIFNAEIAEGGAEERGVFVGV